jgi:hypothetical protein
MQTGGLRSGLALSLSDLNWVKTRNNPQMAAVTFGKLATYNSKCIDKGGKGAGHTRNSLSMIRVNCYRTQNE